MILKLFFFLCSTFLSVSAFHDVEDVVVVEEPSHITCREYGEPMPNAEDCSKYHVCGHCEANSGYHPSQTCLYTISCPPDQLFHPSLKMCYRTSVCPTVSFPRHEVPCQFPGETFSHPDGCQKYLGIFLFYKVKVKSQLTCHFVGKNAANCREAGNGMFWKSSAQ